MPFVKTGNQLRFEHEGRYYTVGGFKEELSEQKRKEYVEELNNSKPSRHDEMLEWEMNGTHNFLTARQVRHLEHKNF